MTIYKSKLAVPRKMERWLPKLSFCGTNSGLVSEPDDEPVISPRKVIDFDKLIMYNWQLGVTTPRRQSHIIRQHTDVYREDLNAILLACGLFDHTRNLSLITAIWKNSKEADALPGTLLNALVAVARIGNNVISAHARSVLEETLNAIFLPIQVTVAVLVQEVQAHDDQPAMRRLVASEEGEVLVSDLTHIRERAARYTDVGHLDQALEGLRMLTS